MSTYNEMVVNFSGKYRKKLLNLCSPLEQTFGVNYFVYSFIDKVRNYSCIGTNPDFIQFFFEENMHQSHPLLLNPESVMTGMYLYDSLPNDDYQTNLQYLEQKFQIKYSCILASKDDQGCHLYGFGIPINRKNYLPLFLNESAILKKFVTYFDYEMKLILLEMKNQAVDLKLLDKKGGIKKNAVELPKIFLERSKKIQFLNSIDRMNYESLKFTKREIDIIKLFLEGKTASEISINLELSSRTVEHYIDGLKDKLLSNSKSELFTSLNELNKLNLLG